MPQRKNSAKLPLFHTLEFYKELLKNSNIQAFLLTIRKGEGTLGEKGYLKHFDGTLSTLDVNPEVGKIWKSGTLRSSSIGAYQFQNTLDSPRWPGISALFGFNNIHEVNQDIGALYIIDEQRAIFDILKGDIVAAINKTNKQWVSLPGKPIKKQPRQNIGDAIQFYQDHGGNFEPDVRAEYIAPIVGNFLDILANNERYSSGLSDRHPMARPRVKPVGYDNIIDVSKKIAALTALYGIEGAIFSLGILETGRIIAPIIDENNNRPKRSGNNNKQIHERGKGKKGLGSLFNLPNANPWTVPEYLDNSGSLAVSTPWADAGNLISVSESNILKANAVADNYKKYSIPPLPTDTDNTQSVKSFSEIRPDNTSFPKAGGVSQLNKTNGASQASGQVININLNKPMIENFSINVKDGKEGIGDFKTKVEGVLLEILNSANVI